MFDWIPDKAWEYGGYYVLLIVGIGLLSWAIRSVWRWATTICWEQFLKPSLTRLVSHCDRMESTVSKLVDSSEQMSETMTDLVSAIKSAPQCRYVPPDRPG